jgi:hypothetical protein
MCVLTQVWKSTPSQRNLKRLRRFLFDWLLDLVSPTEFKSPGIMLFIAFKKHIGSLYPDTKLISNKLLSKRC